MRTTSLLAVLSLVLLLAFLPATALAADDHGDHGNGSVAESFGLKRYDLNIWTLVVFALLLIVLRIYAWPPIMQGLERREATIKSAHEEAKQDRISAENKLAEARKQLEDAGLQAKAIVDEARKAADALKAGEKEAAGREIEARKQQVERELAATREAMIKDVTMQAVQIATLMTEKALRREISAADQNRLFEESLAELRANKA